MIAMFCATPYHIFTAINMRLTVLSEEAVDLYIVGNFAEARDICLRIKAEKLFSEVRYMDIKDFNALDGKKKMYKLWKRFWKYLHYEQHLMEYVDLSGRTYDAIYYASRNQYTDYVIRYFLKRNKSLRVNVFEDGLGEYIDADTRRPSRHKRMIFKMIGMPSKIYEYEEMWMYRPEICLAIQDQSKLRKIPVTMQNDPGYQSLMGTIFKYDKKISEHVILFEQDYSVEKEAFPEMLEHIDEKNVLLKTHPRKASRLSLDVSLFREKNVPWEIVCLFQQMDEKILISLNSAACFTPKLIFDQEPAVLYLYKVYDSGYPEDVERMNRINKKLMEIYRDKSKVLVPKTKEELIDILEQYRQV